jgi:hypothetical protein
MGINAGYIGREIITEYLGYPKKRTCKSDGNHNAADPNESINQQQNKDGCVEDNLYWKRPVNAINPRAERK